MQLRRVLARVAAPPNVVPVRIQAHVRLASKRRATASAQQLDFHRPRVRRRVIQRTGSVHRVPLGNGRLGQADEQRLEGVCVCRARGCVAISSGAVRCEDRGFLKVWNSWVSDLKVYRRGEGEEVM